MDRSLANAARTSDDSDYRSADGAKRRIRPLTTWVASFDTYQLLDKQAVRIIQ